MAAKKRAPAKMHKGGFMGALMGKAKCADCGADCTKGSKCPKCGKAC